MDENYGSDYYTSDDEIITNNEYVEKIRKKLDKLSLNEKKKMMLNIITEKQVDKFLLRYEYKNIKLDKLENVNINEFTKYVLSFIKRYQWKAYGFYIEDNDWIIDKTNKNKIKLVNTIFDNDVYDNDTDYFLESLVDKLDDITDDFEVSYNIFEDDEEKEINYLNIIIKKSSNDEDIRL